MQRLDLMGQCYIPCNIKFCNISQISNLYIILSLKNSLLQDCCCSVAKTCLIFCDTINCSKPVFPVLHSIPEFKFMSTESVMLPNHITLCHHLLWKIESKAFIPLGWTRLAHFNKLAWFHSNIMKHIELDIPMVFSGFSLGLFLFHQSYLIIIFCHLDLIMGFLGGSAVRNPPDNAGDMRDMGSYPRI